jgi:hypothetical protein
MTCCVIVFFICCLCYKVVSFGVISSAVRKVKVSGKSLRWTPFEISFRAAFPLAIEFEWGKGGVDFTRSLQDPTLDTLSCVFKVASHPKRSSTFMMWAPVVPLICALTADREHTEPL